MNMPRHGAPRWEPRGADHFAAAMPDGAELHIGTRAGVFESGWSAGVQWWPPDGGSRFAPARGTHANRADAAAAALAAWREGPRS